MAEAELWAREMSSAPKASGAMGAGGRGARPGKDEKSIVFAESGKTVRVPLSFAKMCLQINTSLFPVVGPPWKLRV
jgi:hypothetical protein